jgi:sensor histidine kinase regulating citrate/malate metabolism
MLAEHERDLSLEILSSGRNYYTKLTEMNEHLACLRHDYKHQLNTMQKMLESGQREEVQAYLAKLRTTAKDGAIMEYCISPALNALLNNFAERCEREGISLTIEIISLPQGVIHDYELCVIVGNLLENAIAACLRTPQGREPFIYLSMRPHEDRYGINVENSFDGILANDGKELHSTKKDGGLGIKSIKATIKRHEGEYLPIWDFENFSAFVVLKLER